jgi:uncharacterized protein YndB with AHSA1/START domain
MQRSSEARVYAPDEVLEITRTFEAPRALLFRLWAEPAHRLRWWGPEGYGLSHCEVDFRVGGAWSIAMKRVDGYEHRVRGAFTEIREPSRLCFTYINDEDRHEMLVEMDFVDLGTRTEMRFRQAPFLTLEDRDGHGWGWGSTLELLSDYVRRVSRIDPQPVGPPRIDGVAADIVAASERHEFEKRAERGDKKQ